MLPSSNSGAGVQTRMRNAPQGGRATDPLRTGSPGQKYPNSMRSSVNESFPFSPVGQGTTGSQHNGGGLTSPVTAAHSCVNIGSSHNIGDGCDGNTSSSGSGAVRQPLPKKLASMIGHKNMPTFRSMGAHEGLLKLISVDPEKGLTSTFAASSSYIVESSRERGVPPTPAYPPEFFVGDDEDGEGNTVEVHRRLYGRNALPQAERMSFYDFIKESLEDRTMQILIGAAVISLVLGMTTPDPRTGEVDRATGWIEGFAILLSVAIVTVVSSLNNYRKQEQFSALMVQGNQLRPVAVRRNNGRIEEIRDEEVVVGDIVLVSQGMQLSFDAILLEGTSVLCDECSVTGENDDVPKSVVADPFLISGSSVLEGSTDGVALVCAVGESSFSGEITMTIHSTEKKNTPLQDQLEDMANTIGKFGLLAAVVTFVALFFKELWVLLVVGGRFFAMKFFENITTAIAIVVVAVPEGLPLSVTIALAYSMQRMLGEGNLVRHLAACETMGGATVLCSDKTGTITVPVMNLKRIFLDGEDYDNLDSNDAVVVNASASSAALLLDCIALNGGGSHATVTRNKTSEAMLPLCERLVLSQSAAGPNGPKYNMDNVETVLNDTQNVVRFPFNSNWKQSAVVVRLHNIDDASRAQIRQIERQRGYSPQSLEMAVPNLASAILPSTALPSAGDLAGSSQHISVMRQFVAGAGETILEQCTRVTSSSGDVVPITEQMRTHLDGVVKTYALSGLRVVCCAFLDAFMETSAEANADALTSPVSQTSSGLPHQPLMRSLTLIGIIGLEEKIRPEVPGAIAKCRAAGVRVMMITGDAVYTAVNIASRCGVFDDMEPCSEDHSFPVIGGPSALDGIPGSPTEMGRRGTVLDGQTLRNLTDEQVMDRYISTVKVLARATPLDKKRILQLIKEKDPLSVIAVTGDGTNDAPALKLSDVGFAMNSGSDVAKRASDIVLLSNSFEGMVKATMWGRNVKDNIRKFLQFQLTVNLVACIVSFIGAVMNDQNLSPLKPVQLLWLNLIMDTLAALALATELPFEKALLSRPPESKDTSVILPRMWFSIITQCVFQFFCQIYLLGYAHTLFVENGKPLRKFGDVHLTIVFNTFVWMQIFNFFNARLLSKEEHFFAQWSESYVLFSIVALISGIQVFIVEYGGVFMSTTSLTKDQWVLCVGLGSISLLVGAASRWWWWNYGAGKREAAGLLGSFDTNTHAPRSNVPGLYIISSLCARLWHVIFRSSADRQRSPDDSVL